MFQSYVPRLCPTQPVLKLPTLRHPVKGGMALEGPHIGREEAEADGATADAVVDAVDERRQFLAPVGVGREQIRLMPAGGNQVARRTPFA